MSGVLPEGGLHWERAAWRPLRSPYKMAQRVMGWKDLQGHMTERMLLWAALATMAACAVLAWHRLQWKT